MSYYVKYRTLNDKTYIVYPEKYRVKWSGKSASDFQFKVKRFLCSIWKDDFVYEEFPVKPTLEHRYRLDFFNLTKKIAVEAHGHPGHVKYSSFFHSSHNNFVDGIVRDREKSMWCLAQNPVIQLVEIYPHNLPLSIKWLREKYPKIRW